MLDTLQEMLSWLGVLVSMAGVVVAAASLRRSRWALLLLLGFGAEMAIVLFYRVAPRIISYSGMQPLFLIMSLAGLAAKIAIVVGVAGLLLERREGSMPPPFARN